MTISEQLHFSILSAPIAAADRRALSQAWYSALYGVRGKAPDAAESGRCKTGGGGARQTHYARPQTAPHAPSGALRIAGPKEIVHPALVCERRSPRLELARRMEQLVRGRRAKRAAATFVIDEARARVRVLVCTNGNSVRVIAVCSKRVQATVAAALAQARFAAAARGFRLDARTQGEVSC